MDKVQVLVRSHSDFAGGVDELTFRGTGTLEKTDYGYRLRYTANGKISFYMSIMIIDQFEPIQIYRCHKQHFALAGKLCDPIA